MDIRPTKRQTQFVLASVLFIAGSSALTVMLLIGKAVADRAVTVSMAANLFNAVLFAVLARAAWRDFKRIRREYGE